MRYKLFAHIIYYSVGRVGFERTEYTVTESLDPTVEICLRVFDNEFEYSLFGSVVIQGNSAQGTVM